MRFLLIAMLILVGCSKKDPPQAQQTAPAGSIKCEQLLLAFPTLSMKSQCESDEYEPSKIQLITGEHKGETVAITTPPGLKCCSKTQK